SLVMRPRGPGDCSGFGPDGDAVGVCAFLRPRGPRGRRPPTASGHVASTGSDRPRGTYKGASCLAIFPANQDNHQPIEGSEHLPDALRRAYNEAIQVYNAKVWSATTTLCRRTLEGMVIHLTTQGGGTPTGRTLAQMLRELPNVVDLGKPIT